MFSEIPSILGSIKTVTDFTNLINQSKLSDALREQAIESTHALISLQSALLQEQANYQALLSSKTELENRLIEMENWKNEAAQYELKEPESGVFVYALKPEIEDAGPKHWLCPNCYQDKKKSILIRTIRESEITLHCFKCGANVLLSAWPQF